MNRFILATLLLLAVFTVSAVSATDNLTDEIILHENHLNEMESIENSDGNFVSSSQEDILGNQDDGTFTALQKKINDAGKGSTITLDKDYVYDNGFNTEGMVISKSLTIDGKNHVIDGKLKSRIFKLTGSNIVLKNIIFKRGVVGDHVEEDGGAIRITANDCTVKSCTFINCYNDEGGCGAISNDGSNCNIKSCTFTNCYCEEAGGGAISNDGSNCNIMSCTFTNCYACDAIGGAIDNSGRNCIIKSCTFTNCRAGGIGGGISNFGSNCNVKSCTFTNCYNGEGCGGAIFTSGKNCNIRSCTFKNCRSDYYGGAIANGGKNCNIKSCTFINCYGYKQKSTKKEAIYNDDINYDGKVIVKNCKFKDSIRLSLKKVGVKKSAKKLVLKATLKKANKSIKNKKIIFKFNGKKYSAKTNKKGVAKVTVKKNVLKKLEVGKKVKIQASYGKIIKKLTVKVKK